MLLSCSPLFHLIALAAPSIIELQTKPGMDHMRICIHTRTLNMMNYDVVKWLFKTCLEIRRTGCAAGLSKHVLRLPALVFLHFSFLFNFNHFRARNPISTCILPLTPIPPCWTPPPCSSSFSDRLSLIFPMQVVCGLKGAVGVLGGIWASLVPRTHLHFCQINTAYVCNNLHVCTQMGSPRVAHAHP